VDKRLERVEDKVDALKEDVHELKTDMKVHITTMSGHFGAMSEIVAEHKFDKLAAKKKSASIKRWSSGLGLVSIIIGIIVGISRLIG